MEVQNKLIRAPVYRQIADLLRGELRGRNRVGEKIPPESQLAARFAVTVMTIREAVRVLVEEGILERRQGSGTYVADRKTRQHVAVLTELDIANPSVSYFCLCLIHQLRLCLTQQGYSSRLYTGTLAPGEVSDAPTYPEFIEDLNRKRICGVLPVITRPHSAWIQKAAELQVPVVGNAEWYRYGIRGDSAKMIREGVQHLVRHNRRRVAFLGWNWGTSANGHGGHRLSEVFRKAMRKAQVPVHPEWVRYDFHPGRIGAGWDQFREIWAGRQEKPDGLLISDDMLFKDVVVAILELGIRVPDSLMIVTHANRNSNILCPFPVTRMECNPDEYAQTMTTMLIRLMQGQSLRPFHRCMAFRWKNTGPYQPPAVSPNRVDAGPERITDALLQPNLP